MDWEQSRAVSSTRLRATIVPTQMAKMPFAEYENMGKDIPAASNRSPFQHPKCSPTPHAAWRQTLSRLSIGFGRCEPMAHEGGIFNEAVRVEELHVVTVEGVRQDK